MNYLCNNQIKIDWKLSKLIAQASEVDLFLRNAVGSDSFRKYINGVACDKKFLFNKGQFAFIESNPEINIYPCQLNWGCYFPGEEFFNCPVECAPIIECYSGVPEPQIRRCTNPFPMLDLYFLSHGVLKYDFYSKLDIAQRLYLTIRQEQPKANNHWIKHLGYPLYQAPWRWDFYDTEYNCYCYTGQIVNLLNKKVFVWISQYSHSGSDALLNTFEIPEVILPMWSKNPTIEKISCITTDVELFADLKCPANVWIPPFELEKIKMESIYAKKCAFILDPNDCDDQKKETYQMAVKIQKYLHDNHRKLLLMRPDGTEFPESEFFIEALNLGLKIPNELLPNYYGEVELSAITNSSPILKSLAYPGELSVIHRWSDVTSTEIFGALINDALRGKTFAQIIAPLPNLRIWLLIPEGKSHCLIKNMKLHSHPNLKINEQKSSVKDDFPQLIEEFAPDLIIWLGDHANMEWLKIIKRHQKKSATLAILNVGKELDEGDIADHVFELYRANTVDDKIILRERNEKSFTLEKNSHGIWESHTTTIEEDNGGRNSHQGTPICFSDQFNPYGLELF